MREECHITLGTVDCPYKDCGVENRIELFFALGKSPIRKVTTCHACNRPLKGSLVLVVGNPGKTGMPSTRFDGITPTGKFAPPGARG